MTEPVHEVVIEEVLELCGRKLTVYVLDNGQRVIKADDFARFFKTLWAESPKSPASGNPDNPQALGKDC